MKIWSTRYCLTCGITEHNADEKSDGLVVVPRSNNSDALYLHGEGRDWHKSLARAKIRAEEVKIKKLQSLDRQMKKISSIVF